MAYAGLVPREHSSRAQTRRGGITKTGNAHVRFVLEDAAWAYRHRPVVWDPLRPPATGCRSGSPVYRPQGAAAATSQVLAMARSGQAVGGNGHGGGPGVAGACPGRGLPRGGAAGPTSGLTGGSGSDTTNSGRDPAERVGWNQPGIREGNPRGCYAHGTGAARARRVRGGCQTDGVRCASQPRISGCQPSTTSSARLRPGGSPLGIDGLVHISSVEASTDVPATASLEPLQENCHCLRSFPVRRSVTASLGFEVERGTLLGCVRLPPRKGTPLERRIHPTRMDETGVSSCETSRLGRLPLASHERTGPEAPNRLLGEQPFVRTY
ncbi:transposase [Carboxydichorda subterranea]|uniref:transposase n=1 Tax=Carboxydichorda subterranea TaxID=3109565 RepID=UPI0038575118